jgi:hypothetical protein
VFPQLHESVVFDASNAQTQKLRLCIRDQFCGAKTESMLTDAEYVTYMLSRKGRSITWGTERPRVAGTWQRKLRGCSGIHIGIMPKIDAVMEYIIEDVGHLAYVETVFSDGSITITSLGLFEEGMYTSLMMQKSEWIELRPVFIETTS